MKQMIVILLCLLLSGCGRPEPALLAQSLPQESAAPVIAGLYDPDHPMEQANPDLVRAYPLPMQNVRGICPVERDILVLSGQACTTLTRFTGEALRQSASRKLDFFLDPADPSLRVHGACISFFDPLAMQTLVLGPSLEEIRRITLPADLSGRPILSPDGRVLYYCTNWAVMAWDLETGIRRTVKELSHQTQSVTGLHMDGTILECTTQDQDQKVKRFLTTDQGLEVASLPEAATVHTGPNGYFAAIPSGYQQLLLCSDTGDAPALLLPGESWQRSFYLPGDHAAVTLSEDGSSLHYYELSTGLLRSRLTLDPQQTPKAIVNTKDHAAYILLQDLQTQQALLCRWDVLRQPPDPANTVSHCTAYCGPDAPDLAALEACREYAGRLSHKYGIRICIWEDATALQPWDYRFQPEYLAPLLEKELALLDKRLAQYPKTVLDQTKSHFEELTICLVRQIQGIGDQGSLNQATGIQFFQDRKAYVVITTGKYSEQALYHELYHVMQTHLLTRTAALDVWESLNPAGFVYGSAPQDAEIYLQGQTRAFVDRYSMSALKEDQARVLENAMLSGREGVFQSEYMQRKLRALCQGIREAYALEKHPESLPWEQYLINPLVPKE